MHQMVVGSLPGGVAYRRQLIDVSCIDVSLSLPPALISLSKINKIISSGEDLKKIKSNKTSVFLAFIN